MSGRPTAQWEYRALDLNAAPRRSDGVDLLNSAGSSGWKLVTVTNTGIAYLKRPIEAPKLRHRAGASPQAGEAE
jgi:hypothetical protein